MLPSQRRWLEAEFGHKIEIKGETKETIIAEIKAALESKNRKVSDAAKQFFDRHCEGKAPRSFGDKALTIYNVIAGNGGK